MTQNDKPTKDSLRQHFSQQRDSLTIAQQLDAAKAICKSVLAHAYFQSSSNIGVYLACQGELSLAVLIEHLWRQDISCFVPVIDDVNTLSFVSYSQNTPMHKNRYGILEPINTDDTIALNDLDVLLIPGLAFTHDGKRLGMGGGYYDKTLSVLSSTTRYVSYWGVAHKCQIAKHLPTQQHDILMDQVIAV